MRAMSTKSQLTSIPDDTLISRARSGKKMGTIQNRSGKTPATNTTVNTPRTRSLGKLAIGFSPTDPLQNEACSVLPKQPGM